MVYTISILLFALLAGVAAAIFKIPFWMIVVLIVAISFGRLGYTFYMTYKSKDLDKLEKFLGASRNPLNQYILTHKDGDTEKRLAAIEHLLARYSSPVVQGTYKADRAMLKRQYTEARQAAATIPNVAMKNYSLALIEAIMGKKSATSQYAIAKPWMKSMIAAILSYRTGDQHAYAKHKEEVLATSAGIQYFSNYYFLERIAEFVKK